MFALLLVLATTLAHEGHHHSHAVHEAARPPVYGIEVQRPQAHLDWFDGVELRGDGWTVELWFLARSSDGAPVRDLDLYFSASKGELGPLVEHGEGLYSMAYTPPKADHWAEVVIRARGLTPGEEGVHVDHQQWILPAPGPELVVKARPDRRRQRDAPAADASVVASRE